MQYYGYIYKITNTINNKIYVGKRTSPVFDELYWGGGKIIHLAIKKYGKENFTRSVLEWCSSKEELEQREVFWIAHLDARNSDIGYNLAEGGEGGITYVGISPNRGKKLNLSEESRLRLSAAHNGVPLSEETKEKIKSALTSYWENNAEAKAKYSAYFTENNPFSGKHHSSESIELIREHNAGKTPWNKGKLNCYSEETRNLMGASMRGKDPWNKGKTGVYSPESILKMKSSHTGKKQSQETIDKRKQKLIGRTQSEETRKKVSQANTGRKWTSEQKEQQKLRMKGIQYNITCKCCGKIFISHCSATKYCAQCKNQ